MDAYFYDTETKKRYTISYMDTRFSNGSVTASYQAANIPQSANNKLFWIKSEKTAKSITLYLVGDKVSENLSVLQSFCFPAKDKKAPSIISFKLSERPAFDVVVTNVSSEFDLNFIKDQKLTRCQVTVQFMEIDK